MCLGDGRALHTYKAQALSPLSNGACSHKAKILAPLTPQWVSHFTHQEKKNKKSVLQWLAMHLLILAWC